MNSSGKNDAVVNAEIWSPPAQIDALATVLPKPTLTAAEQNELARLETVIQKGWMTFLDVGSALLKINADRLYRDQYETFENYCHERLGLSRPYAYSLIGSAEVNAQMSAIADIQVKPLTESQFRELIPVPEVNRVEAWKRALTLAGEKPVTAKIIRKAAAFFKNAKAVEPKAKAAAGASIDLGPALELLATAQNAVLEEGKTSKIVWENLEALRIFLEALARKPAQRDQAVAEFTAAGAAYASSEARARKETAV